MKQMLFALLMAASISAQAQQVVINVEMNQPNQTLILKGDSITVKFGGQSFARSRIDMKNGTLTIGSKVVTRSGYIVTVVGMNPDDGKIKIKYAGGSIEGIELKDLGVMDACNGVFCTKETMITKSGYIVKVVGMFADGSISIRYSGGSIETTAASGLALTDACTSRFCTGDEAITNSNYPVHVVGLFSNGKLAIRYRGGSIESADAESLSITNAICANIYVNRVGVCE